MRRSAPLLLCFLVLSWTEVVHAGGYDTPILYSARHIGMGGTAVGYVNDPSALFHNPAGLGHTRRASLLGDFSLLLGNIHASPEPLALDRDSETTVAPFFLLGGAVRATDWLTFGAGIYPVASAGATFQYDVAGAGVENTTKLLFLEAAISASVNLGELFRIGVAYRMTYVSLERVQATEGQVPTLDFTLTGTNFAGLRVGVQATPIPDVLELGFSYRHRTDTTVDAGSGIALSQPFADPRTKFTLPGRLGMGARVTLPLGETAPRLAFATDAEYGLNSQNTVRPLSGLPEGASERLSVPNVFRWKNSWTVRLGGEVGILRDAETLDPRLLLRAGFIWDAKTANEQYPTAFGTPPGATYVATLGAGWDGGPWQVNVAYAYRTGTGNVTPQDLTAPGRESCQFCSAAGNDPYSIRMHGIYVDFGYDFDYPAAVVDESEMGGDEYIEPEPVTDPAPVTEPAPGTEPAPTADPAEPAPAL